MHSGDAPFSVGSAAQGADKPATVQQCHEVIDAQARQIEALRDRLTQQDRLLAELQERMTLSSRNSSKPPSSDGPGVSRGDKHKRARRQRSRGAQRGHPGAYRQLLDQADVHAIHECAPPSHCECGAAVAVRGKPLRHQVFDVAPVAAEVNEYRLYSGVCRGCGKPHRAALPPGVPSGQIGPRALALIGVLGTHYHLTQFKIRDLLAQMMGLSFSVGAISQAQGKVAAALAAPVAEATRALSSASVLHMDETTYPREGTSNNWVWAAIQPKLAVFSVLPSRARYVIHNLIGEQPAGVVVCDRYAGYAFLDAQRRQVCWAHLIRDFRRIAQRRGTPGCVGARLLALGYVMFRWRERGKTSAEQFEPLQRRLRKALKQGAAQTHCSRTAKTCANVLQIWPALWGFITHPGVEPTNNAAEQALRGIVIKRKISGPTRSRRGDAFIANGFSAFESCRRQGRDFLAYMQHAVTAWIDKAPHPSFVPVAPPSG
jgi:transposase